MVLERREELEVAENEQRVNVWCVPMVLERREELEVAENEQRVNV